MASVRGCAREAFRHPTWGAAVHTPDTSFTNFRSKACRIPAHEQVCPRLRDAGPQGGRRGIMLKRVALLGFLAVLVVGNLSGSAEARRGGGCYRGGGGGYGGLCGSRGQGGRRVGRGGW